MDYIVAGTWVVQALVGTLLIVGWVRHGRRRSAAPLFTHVGLMVGYFAIWVAFIATRSPTWAWVSIAVLCIGIPFGEVLMVRRSRQIHGEPPRGFKDYGTAIGDVFKGRMPAKVAFHALFGAAVFFGSLALAIAATVAAA